MSWRDYRGYLSAEVIQAGQCNCYLFLTCALTRLYRRLPFLKHCNASKTVDAEHKHLLLQLCCPCRQAGTGLGVSAQLPW
eukprot:1151547-Pelagomonas_calceolata.AAC.3